MSVIDDLRACFSGRLITDPVDSAPFLTDWRQSWTGTALAIAQPESTADVAAVVRWCAERDIPIVPQGGNTGLSGGAVPDTSGQSVILSLTRLNKIRSVDPVNDTMVVEAGCLLAAVQQAAEEADRLFPLSLAAEGSCTIGGNLSTNAGGTGVLRYGNARELCLGLEVVTAEGEIWNGLRALRKDNSGYDLRDLFIGAEGTLGIITAAVVKLFPRPAGKATAFVAVGSVDAALALFGTIVRRAGAALTAFELIAEPCLDAVLGHRPDLRRPVEAQAPWFLLIEISDLHDMAAARSTLETGLMAGFETGLVIDAALAETLEHAQRFWAIREAIGEAQGTLGKVLKHDISVPISAMPGFIRDTGSLLADRYPILHPTIFGHLGDGNLHYNFVVKASSMDAFEALRQSVSTIVHDRVAAHDGSIAAEHGIGILIREEAARLRSPVETRLMEALKAALDPKAIMNPGKLVLSGGAASGPRHPE
jgi:FAD/FMN-containing dehydrogenase